MTRDPAANGLPAALLGRLAPAGEHIRWVPARNDWLHVKEPLTEAALRDHLAGAAIVGAFPHADGVAREGILDFDLHDDDPGPERVAALETYARRKSAELDGLGVRHLLFRHHAASFHVWFHTAPIGRERLGRWLKGFAADAGAAGIHVDTFPSAGAKGGNAVRLPGPHHKRAGCWSGVWTGSGWAAWPAAAARLAEWPDNPARLFPDPGPGPDPDRPPQSGPAPGPRTDRPGDVFNLLVPVEDVLTARGWAVGRDDGDRVRFTRPGKAGGISASVKGGTVWVFTSSIPGLPPSAKTPYTAFGLVAHLDFGGDFTRAAAELARRGYLPPPTPDARPSEPSETSGVGRVGRGRVTPIEEYVPFPTGTLPAVVRRYVEDTAAAMHCDPSYSALPALAALGAAVGMSHVASPKKGWREPPYVWGLPVGKSGQGKSPPYRDIEDIAEDINDRLEREYERAASAYEQRLDEWDDRRAAFKKSKDPADNPGPKPTPPLKKVFSKGDTTVAALIGTLQDNPRGVLIGQDELNAWLAGFVRYAGKSGASDLPHWLPAR